MERIYRLHYRAQLLESYAEADLQVAIECCKENIKKLQESGRVLTVALYRYEQMLFLYYEAMGQPVDVIEPIVRETMPHYGILESGEEIQTTSVPPTEFMASLTPFLQVWPGQKADRLWVHMYHIYYHNIPQSVESWCKDRKPEIRRGRIAFLRESKLFSYVYYHKALVEEGLLYGDRYQSIALHENILFSYFEEPKTLVNIKNEDRESEVIKEWSAVNPESHFIHMPQGEGENFMLLPALFAMGV